MKKLNVKCPKCGANLGVEATEINVAIPVMPVSVEFCGKQPHPAKRENNANARIEALRKAGVNVSNLFSIRNANGSYGIGRVSDGEFSIVPDDDPIFAAIYKSRTIPNRRLFRRWVMAQVFRMLTTIDYRTGKPKGFSRALSDMGYEYQWKMVIEEMRVQAKLFDKDTENYKERSRWFNKAVVVSMAEDYIASLENWIEKARKRRCKGVPYVRLNSRDIFVTDLKSKIFTPLRKALTAIKNSRNLDILYNNIGKFYSLIKKTYISHDIPQSKAFKDAYKGAGAFFTLKNLILFHDCVFPKMNQETSIAYLNYLVSDKDFEGYKLFGILKDFLITNHIDIEAKQREWCK